MSSDVKVQFSKKVKALRLKRGYSVMELSRSAGISRQHMRDIELANKYVTIKTLCKLSHALGVPMWKLVHFGTKKCSWN
jgi:transcriptional regulator with XRE-family HTH domain